MHSKLVAAPAHLIAVASASLAAYAAFIARCTFEVDNARAFTLFDDAMISMRYARNLVETGTLTWNPGDVPIEGYTNFLWTLWMAVIHLLPMRELQISIVVVLSSVVLLAVTGRRVLELGAALSLTSVALLAVLAMTLLNYGLVYWSLRGMEVALLACVVTSGTFALIRGTPAVRRHSQVVLGVTTAVALLTRTDAIVFVMVWIGYAVLALRGRERLAVLVVLVTTTTVVMGAHTTFRYMYYGDLLPNTYYLKLAGIPLATRIVRGLTAVVFELQVGWILPVGLAALTLTRSQGRQTKLLLSGLVLAAAAYSIYVGGDAWEEFGFPNRYLAPSLPALLVLAASGLEDVAGSAAHRRALALVFAAFAGIQLLPWVDPVLIYAQPADAWRMHTRIAWGVVFALVLLRGSIRRGLLVAVLLLATTGEAWIDFATYGAQHADVDAERVRHGLAIRAATSVDVTIATTPAGNIPYFAHRRCLDLLGKSDKRIARSEPRIARFHPGHVKWDYAYSLGELQPDLVDELFTPAEAWRVEAEKAMVPTWGYDEIGANFFVHRRATGVDRSRLVRDLGLQVPPATSD